MEDLISILTIVAIFLIFLIIILIFVYWSMSRKSKAKKEEEEKTEAIDSTTKVAMEYSKKSIFKFMQFDKIEDNMIIQDNGQRYLMVIECEGVNYDLMSQMEKTAVEAGFVQFLNTLRSPIQLYIQTRTVNIGDSIQNYKNKLEDTKKELDAKQREYDRILKTENYNQAKVEMLRRDILRIKNLYEYGLDVVNDIQKTSQNKNVLRKHYYIVVPYYAAEIAIDSLSEEDKKSIIFSELYTRAQTLIRSLFSCEIKSRILSSDELVELLYIAYNRDESETYGVETAIKAGYNELYSTAPDVLDKRMKSIDKQIEENAIQMAKEAIDEARTEKERKIKQKEEHFEEMIKQLAEEILKDNQKYVGKEVTEEAVQKVRNKKTKEGGKSNEQKTKKATRRTSDAE